MSDLVAGMLKGMIINGGSPGLPLTISEINLLMGMLERAGWVMLEDVPRFVRVH